jgi:Bacterial Ig domain
MRRSLFLAVLPPSIQPREQMQESRERNSMAKVSPRFPKAKRISLFSVGVLVLLIAACSNPSDPTPNVKPEISLSADKTALTGSGDVTLTVNVLAGGVDSVTFKADKGSPIPSVTTPNAEGDFVTTVTLQETTTFTAEATGPGGTTTTPASEAVTVTVTEEPPPPVESPEAPSPAQAFKTYREVTYVHGITPTEFSATSAWTVEGVKGDVAAETKATASGGTVTILAGTNTLAFSYKPKANFTGSDSFEYSVSANGITKTGTIKVEVALLPSSIFPLSFLPDFNSTLINQTVLVTKPLFCTTSPCLRLREGQTLAGKVVTGDNITLTSPTAEISANIPGTRQPGTASGSGTETRVVELSDSASVKDLKISGEGSRYFVAIFGATYDGPAVLEGKINIENVTITDSNGKPIYFACKDFPCSQSVLYGEYDLTIDNLRVESAFDTLVVSVPGKFTFKNSVVELKQPTVNSQAFGDNVGIDLTDLLGATLEFDNVDVYMESPKKKLDNGPVTYTAIPFVISSGKPGETTTLVFKNNDITFGQPDSNWSLSTVKTVKLAVASGAAMNIVDSTGNTSEATGNDVDRSSVVGTITGTLGGLE